MGPQGHDKWRFIDKPLFPKYFFFFFRGKAYNTMGVEPDEQLGLLWSARQPRGGEILAGAAYFPVGKIKKNNHPSSQESFTRSN